MVLGFSGHQSRSSSGSELNRRIGSASDEFNKLSRVWKDSGINVRRKLKIYQACILSKLLYDLHPLVLNAGETRRNVGPT